VPEKKLHEHGLGLALANHVGLQKLESLPGLGLSHIYGPHKQTQTRFIHHHIRYLSSHLWIVYGPQLVVVRHWKNIFSRVVSRYWILSYLNNAFDFYMLSKVLHNVYTQSFKSGSPSGNI